MKKKLMILSLMTIVCYILICPADAVNAASDGLVLWYQKVLPTLLPFAILSGILIDSGAILYLTKYLYRVTKWILPTSETGAFVFFSGFLFGFPMGSKNCALLYQNGLLCCEEAELLAVLCNNISPVFVGSFVIGQQLKMPARLLPGYLLVYLPPILLGNLLLRRKSLQKRIKTWEISQKMPASRFQLNFKIIDTGIMNGFETLTKLGGYIMLFSIAAAMLAALPLSAVVKPLFIGILELTNGIAALGALTGLSSYQYTAALGLTAFGGISGLAQTFSMIKDCPFSRGKYLGIKLILTTATTSGALLYCMLFS